MPMMQSYSKAGDFTVKGKLKSALVDNAIYYGSYLFICGILLIYLAFQNDGIDGPKIKAIASSASNTWGLFLLILLLGYALVEVPRNLWNSSKKNYSLTHSYFKIAKLSTDKCEAEETVDEILDVSNKLVIIKDAIKLIVVVTVDFYDDIESAHSVYYLSHIAPTEFIKIPYICALFLELRMSSINAPILTQQFVELTDAVTIILSDRQHVRKTYRWPH